jgi:hypothetical protein
VDEVVELATPFTIIAFCLFHIVLVT